MNGALRLVADRYAGRPITPGCSNVTRSEESLIASRQGFSFIGLFDLAVAVMGANVGPNFMTNFLTIFPPIRAVMSAPTE